jgi:hypothetical protein
MSKLTLHTGLMGEQDTINISWFDENNVPKANKLDIIVLNRDKPRTLVIAVDGVIVWRSDSQRLAASIK